MNFETLRAAFADSAVMAESLKESRVMAIRAAEDARAMNERMDREVALAVARKVYGLKV